MSVIRRISSKPPRTTKSDHHSSYGSVETADDQLRINEDKVKIPRIVEKRLPMPTASLRSGGIKLVTARTIERVNSVAITVKIVVQT